MGKIINSPKIMIDKPQGKIGLQHTVPTHREEDNIKIKIRDIGHESVAFW
jgi:hypothetical protein